MEQTQKFPTEVVDLPSKGLLYDKSSPLSKGSIEMKYMTAKEEDILTNQNYIEKGVVIDKLIQSLIVDKSIDYGDLLVGDKNALLLASRILGYGGEYTFEYLGEEHTVDLQKIEHKPLHEDFKKATENVFEFELPASGRVITFKLLTHRDETKIEQEMKGLKKINKDASPTVTTRLKYMILSVDGEDTPAKIRGFINNEFLARDSRTFREYISKLQPDVDLIFYPENGPDKGVTLPVGVNFLWPDAEL